MSLKIENQGDTQILRIDGELDALEVQNIRPQLESALEAGANLYIMDVGDMSMVDSSGIGLLVYMFKQAKAAGQSLALSGLQGQPADMISFLKIDQIVPTYPSVEAAQSATGHG